MELKKILNKITIIDTENFDGGLDISGIAYDSRKVVANGLFVAIEGYITDGHLYIDQAIENGAVAIVHEKALENCRENVAYIKVEDSRRALGLLGSAFYQDPSKEMLVAGVTGTNGKTTVTSMLKHIFDFNGNKCGLIGTINNLIGDRVIDNKGRTTPESLEVQETIADMQKDNCTCLFMEVSSHGLALDRVNGVHFDYGIFTNLTQDHLDYHNSFENYFAAKSKLFLQTEKAAIINIDDKWGIALKALLEEKTNLPIISYGMDARCDYFATEIEMTRKGSYFTLNTATDKERIFINIPGEFMIYNAMATIIVAVQEEISMQKIKEAVAHFPGVEGRMEILETKAPFGVVIDYAHSPDSLEKLLLSVRKIFEGRIILVFGCNGDRDKEKRPIMGQIAGSLADYTVITSDNPASEEPMEIIESVLLGVKEKTDQYAIETIRQEGVFHGARLCKPGDVLVLAGKGHEKQEILKTETLYYNEWDTAREALSKLGY
ncbi:UDP-N-acetylmuramoyl-L-alanyl-D-glutamate--2,6-diaminopimelate ligase [Eubacteriaceae bacterium ES2]|nr:UDP-N-acetylmuramoyl-L-alanyl-D-glutamate--2,6-diaminopimelate ligase [Eubacteriaceae bacterium ES2]